MNLNIELKWKDDDPHWDWFNKTELPQIPKAPPAKAVIKFPLFLDKDYASQPSLDFKYQLGVVGPSISATEGTIGLTPNSLKEILGVKRLTKELRETRETRYSVHKYIKSLQ